MGTHSLNLLIWLTNENNYKIVNHIGQKNEFLKKSKVDNGFILLKSNDIHAMIHHGFCTWKNAFNLEISGSKGFIRINSLSKWGDERVYLGLRKYPDGKPLIKQWNYKIDNSWKNELEYLFNNFKINKKNINKINLECLETINLIKKII